MTSILDKRITQELDLQINQKGNKSRFNKYKKKFKSRIKQKEKQKRIKDRVKEGMSEVQAIFEEDKKNVLLDKIKPRNFAGKKIRIPDGN